MKHIYILLFLVNSNLIFAQDIRLFENTWYLTKIASNGIDYFPPTITQVSSIRLTFNQQNNTINTNYCNSMFGSVVFGNNLTDFKLNGLGSTLILCYSQSDNNYENFYHQFFQENYPNNNFYYAIESNETLKTLTINSANNKQAIYTNQNLSTRGFNELNFSVYLDQSTDFVIVELKNQNTENTKVEIVDSSGKIYKSNYFKSRQIKISSADLSSGVYIIKISAGNELGVKKFIKS